MNQYQKILFDKKVYGKNLLESRSFFFSYRNEDDLKNNKTEEINLSGIWKGKFFDDALSDYQEYLLSDYDIEKSVCLLGFIDADGQEEYMRPNSWDEIQEMYVWYEELEIRIFLLLQ